MASTSTKAFSGSAVSPSVERVDAATHLAIQVLPSASSETRSKQINAYNTSALSLLAGASSSHDEVMTSDEPKPPQSSSLANQRCPLDALATLASSAATLDSDAKNTSCSETRHRDRSYSNPEGFEKFSNLYATASSFNPSLSTIDCDGEDVEMDGSEDQIQTKSDSELLRNTRSRILEDLDEERASRGGKGVVTLPHMLAKYSQIYNKGGRVGIYTPAERTAIIAKFRSKRSRRVWNKKIRYNCRKNLADRRLRVKGRFVKRTEVEGLLSTRSGEENCSSPPPPAIPVSEASSASEEDCQESELPDTMPDEVSFEPTKEQPFRRTRRHTIA